MLRVMLALVVVGSVAACGVGGSACDSAVREAADISPMADTVSDLDNAIRECSTLAEFEAAANQFPDALDGVGARGFIANRCAAEPGIESSALCQEIGG